MYQAICLLLLCWKVLLGCPARRGGPDRGRDLQAVPLNVAHYRAHRREPAAPPPRHRGHQGTEPLPPYVPGRADALDGDASALVRPYLVQCERQQRRRALELALDGYDVPGPLWIHGVPVGVAA